jgi:hypothetical protein
MRTRPPARRRRRKPPRRSPKPHRRPWQRQRRSRPKFLRPRLQRLQPSGPTIARRRATRPRRRANLLPRCRPSQSSSKRRPLWLRGIMTARKRATQQSRFAKRRLFRTRLLSRSRLQRPALLHHVHQWHRLPHRPAAWRAARPPRARMAHPAIRRCTQGHARITVAWRNGFRLTDVAGSAQHPGPRNPLSTGSSNEPAIVPPRLVDRLGALQLPA